jgi:hypothetical protein
MAATTTIIRQHREVGIGYKVVYKVVLDSGDTSFTIDDTYFKLVYGISWAATTTGSGQACIFDGTNIKGAGFAANDTIYLTVLGSTFS